MASEKVLLRVSPMKSVIQFWKKGKLSPKFICPFEILERVGKVAYRLALPPSLAGVHLVFHISMLWKYHEDMPYVDFSTEQLDENLTYEEEPIDILNRHIRKKVLLHVSLMKGVMRFRKKGFLVIEKDLSMATFFGFMSCVMGYQKAKIRALSTD
ncbi:PREDICTED: uncharacterized protein LOC109212498 [Nicotiana attenuata]|uniref:uncharacterized protein LOC109212498 n=1 Tax=Nicotiana attenuata TaxID=49451 RepID=UPI000905D384|nr:PREDICTED: uncharacterized protein LOC109212498 [Nicotiana attenuata]